MVSKGSAVLCRLHSSRMQWLEGIQWRHSFEDFKEVITAESQEQDVGRGPICWSHYLNILVLHTSLCSVVETSVIPDYSFLHEITSEKVRKAPTFGAWQRLTSRKHLFVSRREINSSVEAEIWAHLTKPNLPRIISWSSMITKRVYLAATDIFSLFIFPFRIKITSEVRVLSTWCWKEPQWTLIGGNNLFVNHTDHSNRRKEHSIGAIFFSFCFPE